MPRKPTSSHPRWRNPLSLCTLFVRKSRAGLWLLTRAGGKRESTGIRWPELKKDQTKTHTEGMKLLAERALLFKHPDLRLGPYPTPAALATPHRGYVCSIQWDHPRQ